MNPHRITYLIPLGLLLLAVFFGVSMGLALLGWQQGLQKVIVPGEGLVEFGEAGNYMVFYEYESVFRNKTFSTGKNVPSLEFSMISKSSGARVELVPTGSRKTSYSGEGVSGESVFDFVINEPGQYGFSASYPGGASGDQVVFAFGKSLPMGQMFMKVGLALLFGVGGFLLFALVFILRKKSEQNNIKSQGQGRTGIPQSRRSR